MKPLLATLVLFRDGRWRHGISASVVLVMITVLIGTSKCQSSLNQEFALCFMGNGFQNTEQSYPDSGSCIYVYSYSDTAHIVITCKHFPSYRKTIVLPPRQGMRYTIWHDIKPVILSNEIVDDKAVMIESDKPIFCAYQQLLAYQPTDCAVPFPMDRAGGGEYYSRYVVLTSPVEKDPGDTSAKFCPSAFVVAAFQDNTDVTIVPSCQTRKGNGPADVQHYLLNRGQCVQIYSSVADFRQNYDLTGSIVTARKPISVYGCNGSASVPVAYGWGGRWGDESPIIEAIPKVDQLGKRYVCRLHAPRLPGSIPGTTGSGADTVYDIVKVVATNPNTKVSINGNSWVTLQSGEYRDTALRGVYLIEGTEPILVNQFDHSSYRIADIGGPSMAWVPPVEQTATSYDFVSCMDFVEFNYSGPIVYSYHYVVIVGKPTIRNALILDGQALPDTGFVSVPSVNGDSLVIGSYAVSSGFHTLATSSTSSSGFTVLAYGATYGSGYSYGLSRSVSSDASVVSGPSANDNIDIVCNPNPCVAGQLVRVRVISPSLVQVSCEVVDLLGRRYAVRNFPNSDGVAIEFNAPKCIGVSMVHVTALDYATGQLVNRIFKLVTSR